VNIPTIRAGSSQPRLGSGVKKWDNGMVGVAGGVGLPKGALWRGRFSKTGQVLKPNGGE
jgi:hypothetical protein